MTQPPTPTSTQKLSHEPLFPGMMLAFSASTLFAGAGTVTRFGVAVGAQTAGMMVIQALVAALLAWASVREFPRLERHSTFNVLCLSLVGGTGAICMIEGYARLGVAPTAIILSLYPGIVGLYLWVFEKQRPTLKWFLALLVAVSGVVLAMSTAPAIKRPLWEYVFPVTATMTLAGNDLLIQRLTVQMKPGQAIGWVNFFTALMALAVYNVQAIGHLGELPNLTIGGFMGAMLFLALQLKFMGIGRIGARLVSLIATAQPVLAILIAAVVLGDKLLPNQIGGAFLVMVSLGMITRLR